MRAPRFWTRAPGLSSMLLSPLGKLYAAGTARRLAKGQPFDPGIPVICIGNLTAGGTGKTPTVIALVQMLSEAGASPHVISRGHKGQLAGPVKVDPKTHDAAAVGDEPLLIAAFATTWVSRDRAAAARQAKADGATHLVLDDGFQDPSLAKAVSIVVVDARTGFGNGRCIPAGPLREPVATGLARANFTLSIGPPDAQEDLVLPSPPPRLRAALQPLETGMDWQGLDVLAFAGIGRPEKFFNTLKRLGANLVHAEPLADHQALTQALMSRLETDAKRRGAQLVTTEKDAVRLPADFRTKVLTLPVRLELEDPKPLQAALSAL